MKTAVEWLVDELSLKSKALKIMLNAHKEIIEQAKEIEVRDNYGSFVAGYDKAKETLFTEEQVIAIVEKSRATGLTAEYIIQSLKQGDDK
jgi:DNA-binding transcriptional regulator YhcF (GntR family)